ncbi:aminotransferase class I/II-fold pyridoxal phosphate-dependent enzyme [Nocardioides ferulae]|uniref:aminotransferase class I/II-fold pyridoxal phosphate-dependent enzyme n=1 Tax=Nocardioides ferulae TaxID=2340821 RepID=UPI0019806AE0|nr:aminotransferase class I/II-fold pyridoxal phosphate-dependent enzyme [Nocardioides ferulae]
MSKGFWGGLRVGWIRAPHHLVDRLTSARLGLDLGVPVLEQLVAARLLDDPGAVLEHHRSRLRGQRDRLVAALTEHLPDWRFRVPSGGLVLWCELPEAAASAVAAAAERGGVTVAPGPVFAPEGGFDRFLRLPWTRPGDELEEAVRRVATAWEEVRGRADTTPGGRPGRVMVA